MAARHGFEPSAQTAEGVIKTVHWIRHLIGDAQLCSQTLAGLGAILHIARAEAVSKLETKQAEQVPSEQQRGSGGELTPIKAGLEIGGSS